MSKQREIKGDAEISTAPGLGRQMRKGLNGRFHWEPSLTRQFLPGCGNCGHRHPLAMKPVPLDIEHCPKCGASIAAPGLAMEQRAVLTTGRGDPLIWLGAKLLSIGEWLHNLAKRIDP